MPVVSLVGTPDPDENEIDVEKARPNRSFTEIGSTGLQQYGGRVQVELLQQLQGERGRKIYREMADNDAIIGAILFTIDQVVRGVDWRVEPRKDRSVPVPPNQQPDPKSLAELQAEAKLLLIEAKGKLDQEVADITAQGLAEAAQIKADQQAKSDAQSAKVALKAPASAAKPPGVGARTGGSGQVATRPSNPASPSNLTKADGQAAPETTDPNSSQKPGTSFLNVQEEPHPVIPITQDEEIAAFVWSCLDDLSTSWEDLISQILSMLIYGWSYFEVVYKKRTGLKVDSDNSSKYEDGKIGWRKIAHRGQESLHHWEFDDSDGIRGMWQNTPTFEQVFIPIEKSLLFRTTSQRGNPEGRSVLRNAYRCFSSDTDLLTRGGWKSVGDVTTEDEVATLEQETGRLVYQRPSETWEYEHAGDMVRASSRFVDQLVTPNHRMWVRRDHKEEFEFIEAQDCKPSYSLAATAEWDAVGPEFVEIAGEKIKTELWAEFLGWWLSEGHEHQRPNGVAEVGISQNEGAYAEQIRNVLAQLPWKFNETKQPARGKSIGCQHWRCYDRGLWAELAPLGKARTKRVPRYVFDWSVPQVERLLEAYVLGDGSRVGRIREEYANGDDYGAYRGTDQIYTSSRGMVDDLMQLALHVGYRPQMHWHENPEQFGEDKGIWAVTLGKPFHQMRARWEMVEYEGMVHCVTTDNGIVYTRRNGKCSWSGNSWYFKKRIEELEAIGIERDLVGLPVMYVPPEMLSPQPTETQRAALEAFKELVRRVKRDEQEGLVLPIAYDEKGNQLYKFELIASGGKRQFNTDEIIGRYEQRITMVVLADFIMLGHQRVGAFNLGIAKIQMFMTALKAWLKMIADVFNSHAIPRLLQVNGIDPSLSPELKFGNIEHVDLKTLGDFLFRLSQSQMPLFPDKKLEAYLRRQAGMPGGDAEQVD